MNPDDTCWLNDQVHWSSTCDGNSVTPLNIGEQSYFRDEPGQRYHIITFPAYTGGTLEDTCFCFEKALGGYKCSDTIMRVLVNHYGENQIQYDSRWCSSSCSLTPLANPPSIIRFGEEIEITVDIR